MNELVSIIMPSYNTGRYISKSIGSVLAQTYTNWELIIVDDCSTDDTDSVVRQFDDPRIRFLKNEKNSGAALSRNRALREAQGKWIAFLDSDDIWVANKLEKQIAFMKGNGYRFSFTDYRIQLNGQWLPYINTAPNKVTRRKLFNWCYFSTITVMYDRDTVGLIQVADLRKNNDYAMWFQALEKCTAYRLPECMSYYIKHNDSVSGGGKLKLIKWHYILYRKGLLYGKFMSALLTVNNVFHGVLKKLFYRKRVRSIPNV